LQQAGRLLARPQGAPPRGHCCVPILGRASPEAPAVGAL